MSKVSLILPVIALAISAPALGQGSDRTMGEALLTTARVSVSPPRPARCRERGEGGTGTSGDIVVCAQESQRIAPTSETDPMSRAGLRNGALHPPQLGKGSCKGAFGCLGIGGARPPAYIIDLKSVPEAPAGSDADRVAKGDLAER
jgi:hypothetical protein